MIQWFKIQCSVQSNHFGHHLWVCDYRQGID
jgi:hypothetical protein